MLDQTVQTFQDIQFMLDTSFQGLHTFHDRRLTRWMDEYVELKHACLLTPG